MRSRYFTMKKGRKKRFRWLRLGGIILAALVGIIAAAVFVISHLSDQSLKRTLNELREQDYAVSLNELITPCPEKDNAYPILNPTSSEKRLSSLPVPGKRDEILH